MGKNKKKGPKKDAKLFKVAKQSSAFKSKSKPKPVMKSVRHVSLVSEPS